MGEAWLDELPALAAEDRFRAALKDNRVTDAAAGGVTVGPHRSDLAVTHAERGVPAETMSTGEQKALLISIVLAHARLQREMRGEPPLLLLDEIAAHLDATRRDALFAILLDLESQVWLTGTDTALFLPLRAAARFLSVSDGALFETTI
jgi:DNA replication and repair protein RecF